MQYKEGHLLDNRYLLKQFIGSGSYGEVWLANDNATDLEVAIKIYIAMDDQGLEDFKREFRITFDFNHTNLLHANFLGVNEEDRRPYLVMPYCPDGSVSQFAGQMTEDELWRFLRDVAAGLAYLHSRQPAIIHQDIKPDNILIFRNGDFVITDFGISKQLRASLRKSAMNLNNTNAAGSISYMGPERFSKQFQPVKASDIWSVGASLYELAVGDVPFCGMGGSLQKKGADMPELPEEYSPRLNMIMQACMAKEPWNRPSAMQLSTYADRVLKGEDPPVTWGQRDNRNQQAAAPAAPVMPQTVRMTPQAQQPAAQPSGAPQYPQMPQQTMPQYPPVAPPQQAMPQYPPVEPQYPPMPVSPEPAKKAAKGSIPGWVWAIVAVAGLVSGYIANLYL